eukprot:1405547-Alexandrium_andersonii.AAC.1
MQEGIGLPRTLRDAPRRMGPVASNNANVRQVLGRLREARIAKQFPCKLFCCLGVRGPVLHGLLQVREQ